MSLAALLRATRDTLRSVVPELSEQNSGVHYDGQPPPSNASPLYLAIHPSGWRPGPSEDIHEATEDEFGIDLSISFRTSVIPRDRWGSEAYLDQARSLEAGARLLFDAMYGYRYDLINLANEYLSLDVDQGWQIIEPLLYDGTPMVPQPVDAAWFHAQDEGDLPNIDFRRKDVSGKARLAASVAGAAEPLNYHGLLMVMSYYGGRRIVPSKITGYIVRVGLTATRDQQPAVSGSYGGTPDSITVTIDGNDYTPSFSNGQWSIPQGTIATLAFGTYDIEVTAVYEGGDVVVTDGTVDELTVIDPQYDWLWVGGNYNVWGTGNRSVWEP